MKRIVPISALVLLLSLTGCTSTQTPEASSDVTPTSSTPITSPTSPEPAAEERGPDTPLEIVDVYALCKAQTLGMLAPNQEKASWDSFEDAITLVRDDGGIGVYVNAVSGDRESAIICMANGSIGDVEWLGYGVQAREADRDTVLKQLNVVPKA